MTQTDIKARKVNVRLDAKTLDALEGVMGRNDISLSQAIRTAVIFLDAYQKEYLPYLEAQLRDKGII